MRKGIAVASVPLAGCYVAVTIARAVAYHPIITTIAAFASTGTEPTNSSEESFRTAAAPSVFALGLTIIVI